MKKNKEEEYMGKRFLGLVASVYVVLYLIKPETTLEAVEIGMNILTQILLIVPLIVLLMWGVNYFMKPKKIKKYVGQGSGSRGWIIAVATGILSHGPTYIWYPILRDLKSQGMKNGLIAAFLYARAVKLPLLPLMAYYFGVKFVLALTVYMTLASIIEGKTIDYLVE